jgi:phage tail-like protein
VEFREAGSGTVQKLPGNVKYAETVCRRRVVPDIYFWDWRLLVEQGIGVFRRTANVILYDDQNVEVARWELTDAWPSRTFISETKETKGYAEEVFVLTSRQTRRIR